ncbi:unnamed protein product [Closterium sp. NIES-65]|nr:unnamed protein product [Closterium sp. NIES-65]
MARRQVATGGAEAAALHLRDGGNGMTHGRHHSAALLITRLRRNGEARRERCSCWPARVHAASTPPHHCLDSPRVAHNCLDSARVAHHCLDSARLAHQCLDSPRVAHHCLDSPRVAHHCLDSPRVAHHCLDSPRVAHHCRRGGEGAAGVEAKVLLAWTRACWDDARPAVTGVWLPPTRPADHALAGKFRLRGGRGASAGQQEASTRGARGQRGAARGFYLIPHFQSLQHGGQRGDDTAGGTDGGEVLIYRFSKVDSWGEEGEGAVRGSKRLLSNPPLPFPLAWRAARRRHGGRHTDGAGRVQDSKTAPDCGIGVVRQGSLTALGRTRPTPEAPLCYATWSELGCGTPQPGSCRLGAAVPHEGSPPQRGVWV